MKFFITSQNQLVEFHFLAENKALWKTNQIYGLNRLLQFYIVKYSGVF